MINFLNLSLSLAYREAAKFYILILNVANFLGLLLILTIYLLVLQPFLHTLSCPLWTVKDFYSACRSLAGPRKWCWVKLVAGKLLLVPSLRVKAIGFLTHTIKVKEVSSILNGSTFSWMDIEFYQTFYICWCDLPLKSVEMDDYINWLCRN